MNFHSETKKGLLSPNTGNSNILESGKINGLLSDISPTNVSSSKTDSQPKISLVPAKGFEKSIFEEDIVNISLEKASLAEKLNQIKEKKIKIKKKIKTDNFQEFSGTLDEETDSLNNHSSVSDDKDPFDN